MQTHLCLLRGINVSGHNLIKMEDLKTSLTNIGFLNVQTYIQSGNVFVDSIETNAAKIGFIVKQQIQKSFGHDVNVVVIAKQDLEFCLSNNLYLKEINCDTKKLYVAFLSKELQSTAINELKISQFKPDEAVIIGNKIFIKYHIGAGKTKLDQKYIEKKLNLTATIRNWNTISKLLEIYNL